VFPPNHVLCQEIVAGGFNVMGGAEQCFVKHPQFAKALQYVSAALAMALGDSSRICADWQSSVSGQQDYGSDFCSSVGG
jgi:hypothetical protein